MPKKKASPAAEKTSGLEIRTCLERILESPGFKRPFDAWTVGQPITWEGAWIGALGPFTGSLPAPRS